METPVGTQGAVPARWWAPVGDDKALCELCPRYCRIGPGQRGYCYIRRNAGGRLYTEGYGFGIGFAVDPIEKKPLYHVLPGCGILSFGTAGCNMGCRFCQNWTMSTARRTREGSGRAAPADVVRTAESKGCRAIAFTYNEPTIFGEYVVDVSEAAREAGLLTVMVTNGYISPIPAAEIYRLIDAANVDLKAFSDDFYRRLTRSSLKPVLDFLSWLRRDTDVWIELTNLVIPGENDDPAAIREMCRWIAGELGEETPLHLTAFHPDFRMLETPRTPHETLLTAAETAAECGLRYVYLGNVADAEHGRTICPDCNTPVVERSYMGLKRQTLAGDGACPECGRIIPGIWGRMPAA